MKLNPKIDFCLNILEVGRSKILTDFIQKDIELYNAIEDSHDGDIIFDLNKEIIILQWLNYHWLLMDYIIKKQSSDNDFISIDYIKFFSTYFIKLVQKYQKFDNSDDHIELYKDLLKDKVDILKKIINVNNLDNLRYNNMVLSYKKDKRKIKDLIKQLKNN